MFSCGLARTCQNKALSLVTIPLVRLWVALPRQVREETLQNESIAFQACSVGCAFNSKMLWEVWLFLWRKMI
jgi:hypothetical protein